MDKAGLFSGFESFANIKIGEKQWLRCLTIRCRIILQLSCLRVSLRWWRWKSMLRSIAFPLSVQCADITAINSGACSMLNQFLSLGRAMDIPQHGLQKQ